MRLPCDISVVVCTFNRSRLLASALEHLLNQPGAPPHEVIVVDNDSTDETRAVVAALQLSHTHLRYVLEPRRGLPHARNAGIQAAAAPIIAFTDDDVRVRPDWIAAMARAFETFPYADCVGGPVVPRWPASGTPEWLTTRQLAPLALQDKGPTPLVVDRENAAPCLIGANFAFRRSAFAKCGLFSTDYPRSQDREIQLRLWRAGGVGVYTPDVAIDVDVPEDRLTREYFRLWYARAGRYHSRMGLLDRIDTLGRMVDPPAHADCLLGVPPFLYSKLLGEAWQLVRHAASARPADAFYHENRLRYLGSYIRERWHQHRPGTWRDVVRDLAAFTVRRARRPQPAGKPASSPEIAA